MAFGGMAFSFAAAFSMSPAAAQMNSPARVDTALPHPQPPYPDSAQQSGEQGTVLVDVLVRTSGRPVKARISQSSGFQDLDNAAVQGVLNWHFLPATQGGDTVSDWTTVKIVYQLPTMVPAPTQVKSTNP
jgi:protein TonB